jgi:cold shock CspA family protein
MRNGTITSYDRGRGAGIIQPDDGGSVIVFKTADQPKLHAEPQLFQRYRYSILTADDGGQPRAINLNQLSSPRLHTLPGPGDQLQTPAGKQENDMDLNELLHAHQLEVMKLAASESDVTDEGHFSRIAQYADRIRGLRDMPVGAAVAHHPSAPPTIIYGSYAGSAGLDGSGTESGEANENPDRDRAHD